MDCFSTHIYSGFIRKSLLGKLSYKNLRKRKFDELERNIYRKNVCGKGYSKGVNALC
jgi:hypothetical protein